MNVSDLGSGDCVVDFWASWCGPCRFMLPIFDEVSREIEDVNFLRSSVDEDLDFVERANVSSLPCFVFYKDGKETGRISGTLNKDAFKAWILELHT